jgi:hypothetical protein
MSNVLFQKPYKFQLRDTAVCGVRGSKRGIYQSYSGCKHKVKWPTKTDINFTRPLWATIASFNENDTKTSKHVWRSINHTLHVLHVFGNDIYCS